MPKKMAKKVVNKKRFPVAWLAGGLIVPLVVVVWIIARPGKPTPAYGGEAPTSEAKQNESADGPKQDVVSVASAANAKHFSDKIHPFLNEYCIGCHNDKKRAGEISMEKFTNEPSAPSSRALPK